MVYINIIRTPLCLGDLFGLAAFFALHIALGTVDHNGQAQYNQQHGDDQLQTVGNKHSAPAGLSAAM